MEASGLREQNKNVAELAKQENEKSKSSANPWIKVTENCEMDANKYVGEKDISRMR